MRVLAPVQRKATAWLLPLAVLATVTLLAGGAAALPRDPLDCDSLLAGSEPPPSADFIGPVQYVTVSTHKLAYRRVPALGQAADGVSPASCLAPPLVLLYGYGGTMAQWGTRLLRRLALSRELILIDNPAQGLSEDLEAGTSPMTMPVLSRLLLGFLEALGLSKPHLAGFSLGGCIALKLAADHPEAVGKVVAFGANSMDGRAVLGSPDELGALFVPTNDASDYAPFFFNTSNSAGRLAACRWIADAAAMPEDKPRPEVNQRYAAGIMASVDPQNTAIWDALPSIRAPVLLMGGLDDVVVPSRAQPELAARIPGAWLAQFPGAGHALWSQLVEPVAATMDVFLQHAGPATVGEARQGYTQTGGEMCGGTSAMHDSCAAVDE